MDRLPKQFLNYYSGFLPRLITNAGPKAMKVLEQVFAGSNAPDYQSSVAMMLHRFFNWCEQQEIKLQDINVKHLHAYHKTVKRKTTGAYALYHIRTANRFVRSCVELGVIEHNVKNLNQFPRSLVDEAGSLPKVITESGPHTIQAIKRWLNSLHSTKGRARMAGCVRHFTDWCERTELRLEDVTPGHLRSYLKVVEGKFHPKTAPYYKRAASHLLLCCMEVGAIPNDDEHAVMIQVRRSRRGPTNERTPNVPSNFLDNHGQLPSLIIDAGDVAVKCVDDLFGSLGNSTVTKERAAVELRRFCRWCSAHNLSLDRVTSEHVGQLIAQLRKSYSNWTVKKVMSISYQLYELLRNRGYVDGNPIPGFDCVPPYTAKHPTTVAKDDPSTIPSLIASAGDKAIAIYCQYVAQYDQRPRARSVLRSAVWSFSEWCEAKKLELSQVAAHSIQDFARDCRSALSSQTVSDRIGHLRRLFGKFNEAGIIPVNPVLIRVSVKSEQKPASLRQTILPNQIQQLINSVNVKTLSGLRDRAILSVVFHAIVTIREVVQLNTNDFLQHESSWWLVVGSRRIPTNDTLTTHLHAYLQAAKIAGLSPLFQQAYSVNLLSGQRMTPHGLSSHFRAVTG